MARCRLGVVASYLGQGSTRVVHSNHMYVGNCLHTSTNCKCYFKLQLTQISDFDETIFKLSREINAFSGSFRQVLL